MQIFGPFKKYRLISEKSLNRPDIVPEMEDVIPEFPQRISMLFYHSSYPIGFRDKFAEVFWTIILQ
jgi:hypothetical protein